MRRRFPELDDVATDRLDRLVELRVGLADSLHQLGVVCPIGETTDAGLQVEKGTDDAIVEFARDPQALGADFHSAFLRSEFEEFDRARGLRGERRNEADVSRFEWGRVCRASDDHDAARASDLSQGHGNQGTCPGRRSEGPPSQGYLAGITGDDVRRVCECELGQRVPDGHDMADRERTDDQAVDAPECHLAGVRHGDDDAGNGIDEDACLTGDPAEELLEVVAVENGLGQRADRLNVAIDAPGRSGLFPPHDVPSKRASVYARRKARRSKASYGMRRT